jgi:hypothetical protein
MRWRSDRSPVIGILARAALLPPAAFAVHQLRYVLAFGADAGIELQRQGHSYLHSVVPWIVVLIALVAGGFLWALGRACAGQTTLPRFTISFSALWLACTVALVTIYATQESLEGLMVTGHPGGLAGIFGYGGWWAIPVAACVGLVLAAVFHGARWVLDGVARRYARPLVLRARAARSTPRPPDVLLPRLAPLAGGWSGRGPPV